MIGKMQGMNQCMQEYLFGLFKSKGRSDFLSNVSIKLIDKRDGKDPKRR